MWHHREESLDKVEIGFLEGDVDLSVYQLADLRFSCFCNGGMTMTQVRDSDTTSEIKLANGEMLET